MSKQLKLLLLAGNTYRSRAYAQTIENLNIKNIEVCGIFYGFDEKKCNIIEIDTTTTDFFKKEGLFTPNFKLLK